MVLCMRSFRTQWGTSRAPGRREGINQAISPAPWSGLQGINLHSMRGSAGERSGDPSTCECQGHQSRSPKYPERHGMALQGPSILGPPLEKPHPWRGLVEGLRTSAVPSPEPGSHCVRGAVAVPGQAGAAGCPGCGLPRGESSASSTRGAAAAFRTGACNQPGQAHFSVFTMNIYAICAELLRLVQGWSPACREQEDPVTPPHDIANFEAPGVAPGPTSTCPRVLAARSGHGQGRRDSSGTALPRDVPQQGLEDKSWRRCSEQSWSEWLGKGTPGLQWGGW